VDAPLVARNDPVNPSRLRFLVVEDQAFQRRALVRLLRNLGAADVLEAPDGAAALQQFLGAARPVDVIVSDLDMPEMDGLEFLRHIGQSGRSASVVLASAVDASVLASVKTMARGYGVNLLGVVPKPVTPAALLDVLKGHTARARPQPPSAVDGPPTAQEIREGFANDEFEAFFQPKVEIASLHVKGFEALARWRRPEGKLVSPASFLPVMEQHGLVDQLTWTMLDKGVAFCSSMCAGGTDCSVSINLSVKSLADSAAANRLASKVLAAGLEPRHVMFEVTESATAEDQLAPVLESLTRLRLRGFGLSIDDYGTGYSSLQQLGRIPFTELKIDRTFVRNAGSDEAAMILLESSLDIARKLKLVTVAEGVETRDEWNLLRRLGCDLVQGFLLAPPMPPLFALGWLQDWNQRKRGSFA
jgi:EAL domain-containing protein (putative c-di-GMP-specific phosphodiesterase class I)/ActR/RegA family two-component response regulator